MKKTSIVLSGGSIKGAFQAGALEVVLSNCSPVSMHGISVGSLNSGFLANEAGKFMLEHDKINDEDWLAFSRNLSSFWLNNITSFSSIGKNRYKGIKGVFFFFDLLAQNFKSMIDTKNLKELVKNLFNEDNIRRCPIPFSAGAVNIYTGELISANNNTENVIDYIIASTAIPIIMPIQIIKNEPFLDGGIRDVAPLGNVFALDPKPEQIVCILCQPENVSPKELKWKNLLVLANRLMELVTNEIVNNDIKIAQKFNSIVEIAGENNLVKIKNEYSKIPIIVVRPERDLDIDLEEFTSGDIKRIHSYGIDMARKVFS